MEETDGEPIPIQTRTGSEGSRRLRLPKFQDNQHMVSLEFFIDIILPIALWTWS
jgi:hypothetical protein